MRTTVTFILEGRSMEGDAEATMKAMQAFHASLYSAVVKMNYQLKAEAVELQVRLGGSVDRGWQREYTRAR